jgi:NAD(P)-dependent dehydrogenase (short-subunit alcohol dehydrogenase family)
VTPFKVLILGGSGVFGSRLCRLLADDPRLAVTAAGRERKRLEPLEKELDIATMALDWRRDLDRALDEQRFVALVHVAGPFQRQDYAVAETCIRHGVHYLDLADDAAFVCGIDKLDEAAKAASVLVCSGASTAPAITGAVVETAREVMSVERVRFGIVPGNDAPRGPALVAAILSRAGKPIADQPGRRVWGTPRRMKVPGLGTRWVAACELPEPKLFAQRFGVRDTYAGAGLELAVLHLGLWLLSWLVRLRLVRSLAPFAPRLTAIAGRLRRFGTDRGGLRIDVEGPAARRCWYLIAEGGDGPFVPVLPAAALVRKLAAGRSVASGAMPCLGLVSLGEILAEARRAHLQIASAWRDSALKPSLYRRVLGGAYEEMPAPWRALHDGGASTWKGQCVCDPAETWVGRAISRLFQFPASQSEAPISVEFTMSGAGEIWTRRIGGRVMRSRQYIGVRGKRGAVVEQFGPLAFDLDLPIERGRVDLVMTGARCVGIPLPRWCWPRIKAFETGAGGKFRFDVEIGLPGIGRLVRYRGWLTDR